MELSIPFRSATMEMCPCRLRIYTLGRFSLAVDGREIAFSGKVQKKPLDLLKILISLGSTDVNETRFIDALWPEIEGDAANRAFKIALHRLRQLVGIEGAVRYQDGRLSLDHRLAWVDIWVMEKTFRREWESNGERLESASLRLAEEALALYNGPFLPGDDRPWTESCREKAKSRFLVFVRGLARHFENGGQWQQAAEVYLHGLETEDLAEELYRRLMRCYQQSGCRGEAIRAYERCRNVLNATAGIKPALATEALYRQIMQE
jgi:DNA-binding SARP family transcriptional activator